MSGFEGIGNWDLDGMKKTFGEKGFVCGGKLLSDGAVDILNEKIAQYVENRRKANSTTFQTMGGNEKQESIVQLIHVWKGVDEVADIIRSPVLAHALGALTGETKFRLYHDQLQFKPALVGGINCWHQDVEFWPFVEPYTQITAWIALDDISLENGCMRMVPGSHKWGPATQYLKSLEYYEPLPGQYQGHAVEVERCIVPKGHVHFHHHLTWHGSGPNSSNAPRRALACHFMGGRVFYEPKFGYTLELNPNEEINSEKYPQAGTNFDSWPVIAKKLDLNTD